MRAPPLIAALGLSAATASVARADLYELQLGVAPTVSMSLQQGQRYVGSGMVGVARYGLYERVALEAAVGCDCYQQVYAPEHKLADERAYGMVQDSWRCALVPAVAATFGRRLLTAASVGLGYLFDHRSNRQWVSADGTGNGTAPARTGHELVAQARFGLGFRFWTMFSLGAFANVSTPISGTNRWLGLHAGLLAGVLFYP